MKPNTYLILTLLFISLSIWLSFTVKNAKSEIAQKERLLIQIEEKNHSLQYRQKIMQEAFFLNLINEPVALSQGIAGLKKDKEQSFILYLKANACSPCNIGVIRSIAQRHAENKKFLIASHTSNRHFLLQALHDEQIDENKKVIWLTDKLYSEDRAVYDAELLFINPKGFISGILPLELLKEAELFEPLLAKLMKREE
jgi:hypothetical protein